MISNTQYSQHLTEKRYVITFTLVVSLFVLWGVAITMGDVLNRHFQKILHISKAESALVQFSLFGAYAIMAIPAGIFMQKYGYKNGVIMGLLLYALGAFLFIPASNSGSFTFFRIALFVLACGLATLETVAHPFIAALGNPNTSAQRLNFAQAFNGVGGVIGPLIGGYFILRNGQGYVDEFHSIKAMYTVIGLFILFVCIVFVFLKVPALQSDIERKASQHQKFSIIQLFKRKHFAWAVLAQFCCAATQGGTWAFFIIYGIEKIGLTAEQAAYYFSLSMLLKMSGRFLGVFVLRKITPNRLLAICATANILICLLVAQDFGWTSFVGLILLNLFFSIMYPTIFSLGLRDLGQYTQRASSFIVMGVVGGALFPPVMGLIANHNVATAYYLPIICYAFIVLYATRLYRIATP